MQLKIKIRAFSTFALILLFHYNSGAQNYAVLSYENDKTVDNKLTTELIRFLGDNCRKSRAISLTRANNSEYRARLIKEKWKTKYVVKCSISEIKDRDSKGILYRISIYDSEDNNINLKPRKPNRVIKWHSKSDRIESEIIQALVDDFQFYIKKGKPRIWLKFNGFPEKTNIEKFAGKCIEDAVLKKREVNPVFWDYINLVNSSPKFDTRFIALNIHTKRSGNMLEVEFDYLELNEHIPGGRFKLVYKSDPNVLFAKILEKLLQLHVNRHLTQSFDKSG